MSGAISVKCPSCKATLKLKNRSAVGKRVPCPKCNKPFVVQAPPEEDDMAFLDELSPADEQAEEEEVAPAPRPAPGKSGRKSKKSRAPSVNWLKPVLIGVVALVFIGALGVGGYFAAVELLAVRNKIDMTYLAPDCDFVMHARVDEVVASDFGKSILAISAIKQGLDRVTKQYDLAVADIKSVTAGLSGAGDLGSGMASAMPGMGAGFGRARAMGAAKPNIRGTIVIRLSKSLPADFTGKLQGYTKVEHQGTTYYRPPPQLASQQLSVYVPKSDVLILADEAEIVRIAEKGSRQVRRADFDFIETAPPVVIAMINKAPTAGAQPASGPPTGMGPGGMGAGGMGRGGMAGMPMGMAGGGMAGMGGFSDGLPSLSGGKVKGWYLGFSFVRHQGGWLGVRVGLLCPESATEARGELDQKISEIKGQFGQGKVQLGMLSMFGLGELAEAIESAVQGLQTEQVNSVVVVTTELSHFVPDAIGKTLDGFAKRGRGFGRGFGGGTPPGFGGGASSGNSEPPEEVVEDDPTGQTPGENR